MLCPFMDNVINAAITTFVNSFRQLYYDTVPIIIVRVN